MFNIFLTVFFATLAFAFVEPYFFIGYLISIALFGLYQAVFMANAGGAWDNAKKIVETELKMKNTPLHAATVVGDTVGDPFKDTSSVALNPVIKFTTLFGLLAVALAVSLRGETGATRQPWPGRRCSSRSRWCSCTARSTACGSAQRRTDDAARNVVEFRVRLEWRTGVECPVVVPRTRRRSTLAEPVSNSRRITMGRRSLTLFFGPSYNRPPLPAEVGETADGRRIKTGATR